MIIIKNSSNTNIKKSVPDYHFPCRFHSSVSNTANKCLAVFFPIYSMYTL